MFRRDAFALIAAALVGSVVAVYASLAETAFFPASLQTTLGECPGDEYYPAHRRPVLEPDEASWFGHQLIALHEEPLVGGSTGQRPTLRFTLLADISTATVRVTEAEGGRLHLTAKWMPPCQAATGCIVHKLLSAAEQARLEAAVEPLLRTAPFGCYGPVDSGSYILEARDGDTYRLWHQTASANGDVGAAGLVALEIAGWSLDDALGLSAEDPRRTG
jgi:hypothetical protein